MRSTPDRHADRDRALGALLAAVIDDVRALTWPEAIDALKQTIRTSAMIF